MIMCGSSYKNFTIPDIVRKIVSLLSLSQINESHMFLINVKQKLSSSLLIFICIQYLCAGLFPALPLFLLRKVLIVFFYLAVVIPQLVFLSTFDDVSSILFLFSIILSESDICCFLQVRLWDISSGALLDTCEVAVKVFYFISIRGSNICRC